VVAMVALLGLAAALALRAFGKQPMAARHV